MILRHYLHHDPAIAVSYLFGCAGRGTGAVVDPVAAPDFYLAEAEAAGVRIRFVIDTHVHADHQSTGPPLAAAAGAEYVLHADAGAAMPFRGVRDGESLELGNVSAAVWHIPGHTPEHLALIVTDHTRADEPWVAFTGHTLMIGDLGRTELASSAEAGAAALFESSLRLRALADHVLVLPGAFAGSVCGRGLSGVPFSTIGFERQHNRAFSITDRDQFIARMLQDIPPRPPRAEHVRACNMGLSSDAAALAR